MLPCSGHAGTALLESGLDAWGLIAVSSGTREPQIRAPFLAVWKHGTWGAADPCGGEEDSDRRAVPGLWSELCSHCHSSLVLLMRTLSCHCGAAFLCSLFLMCGHIGCIVTGGLAGSTKASSSISRSWVCLGSASDLEAVWILEYLRRWQVKLSESPNPKCSLESETFFNVMSLLKMYLIFDYFRFPY